MMQWSTPVPQLDTHIVARETQSHTPSPTAHTVVSCVVDTAGFIREASGATHKVLGLAPAQLIGATLVSLAHPDDRTHIADILECAQAGESHVIAVELQHASAIRVGVSLCVVPIFVDEKLACLHVILSSVTSLTDYDAQQQRAHRMEIVGRLATGLAHDLNNRLLVITGRSRFALDELASDAPVRAHIDEVHRAAERASAVTRQLLAFGRRQDTAARWHNLNDIITGIDTLIDRLVGDPITLTLQHDPGLWPVVIDQVQIEQMLLDLVLNANDAMPYGGTLTIATCNVRVPTPRIPTPSTLPDGDFVRLTVRDTGRGMDASALLEAFDPFSTNRNTAGRTGLGLLCVNAIVQQARGVLDVDSSLGVGTEFSIYFPRAISRTVTPVTSPLQFVERNPVVSENANTTVLVVDDEPAVRTLVRLILEGRGFKVLDARDGHDALLLAEIQRTPIDLLVADIAMPEMDGVELAKQLRGQFPDLRVLFMSGYMTESLVARDSVPTHEALVQKPFAIATLLAAIGNILGVELTA